MPIIPRYYEMLQGDPGYPPSLIREFGPAAAPGLQTRGNLALICRDAMAIVCSARCPGALILRAYDLAGKLRLQDRVIVGGFHSPMERQCLELLITGRSPIIVCPGRSIKFMRIPVSWKPSIVEGRMLLVSRNDLGHRRLTERLAHRRNKFVAALAAETFIPFAAPGGKTEDLAREILAGGKKVLTFNGPQNANLLRMGAVPL